MVKEAELAQLVQLVWSLSKSRGFDLGDEPVADPQLLPDPSSCTFTSDRNPFFLTAFPSGRLDELPMKFWVVGLLRVQRVQS